MSIQSIQAKYPNAVWYDSNHSGSNSGTLENPYTSITTALNAQDRADSTSAVAILNGTHTFTARIQPLDGTILVGESTEAILNFTTIATNYGTIIGQTNGNFSFTLETLNIYYNPVTTTAINRTLIFGGNTTGNFVKIYGCIIEMGPNLLNGTGENRGVFGGRNSKVEWTIYDTSILAGASTASSHGVLFGGSAEVPVRSVDMQRCSIFVKEGTNSVNTKLTTTAFYPVTFIFKDNIVHGRNSESWNNLPTDSSNNCYFNTSYTSSSSGLGTNNIFQDPLFIDPDSADLRLRPGSSCINDSEPSLQDLYPNALWVSGGYTGGSSDGSYDAPYTSIRGALDSNSDADVVVCVKTGATPLTSGYTDYPVKSTVEIIGENGATLDTSSSPVFADMMSASNATYTFKNINFLQNNISKIERGIVGNDGINFNLVLEGCTYKVLDNCGQWTAFRATNMTLKNCFIETYCYYNISGWDGNNAVLIHDGLFTAENCTFYNKKNNYYAPPNDQTSMLFNRYMSVSKSASYTNCIFYAEGSTNTTTGLTGNTFTYRTFTDCCVYSPHNYLNDFTADKDSGTPVLDDPLFVDRANGDFRLRPGSPCITV